LSGSFVDPYCFPGTNVLRNRAGILDRLHLERVESKLAAAMGVRLYSKPSPVTDLAYLKVIHHTLFGKLYPWAGETRRGLGRMTKTRADGSVVQYGDSAFVDSELSRMLGLLTAENFLRGLMLERFAARAAYFYGELDAIHSFREGNSRTLRAFFYSVAYNAGFVFDWDATAGSEEARNRLYRARDRAVMRGESGDLAGLFHEILLPR
jgi:cell filamentation protein